MAGLPLPSEFTTATDLRVPISFFSSISLP